MSEPPDKSRQGPEPPSSEPSLTGYTQNELVYAVLRDHLIGHKLAEGLIVRESIVAELFGVGRSPARMALQRLEQENLLSKRRGHGFEVPVKNEPPAEEMRFLQKRDLTLPPSLEQSLARRDWRVQIYPEVERSIASCLVYGKFQINQSAIAEHFGVSRTIANTILTSLEQLGLLRQGRNSRWYAGPLTLDDIRDNYEMRWLLEPEALRQAAPQLPRKRLIEARDHIIELTRSGNIDPEQLNRAEQTLHSDFVLNCRNRQMCDVLRYCQLPIIGSYHTVVRENRADETLSGIPETLSEHEAVINLLIDGQIEPAAQALEAHIRHGYDIILPHFRDPPPLPEDRIPSYMSKVE